MFAGLSLFFSASLTVSSVSNLCCVYCVQRYTNVVIATSRWYGFEFATILHCWMETGREREGRIWRAYSHQCIQWEKVVAATAVVVSCVNEKSTDVNTKTTENFSKTLTINSRNKKNNSKWRSARTHTHLPSADERKNEKMNQTTITTERDRN